MTLCAPYYGHVETQWHRRVRPHAISNDPHEEKILASKIDMSAVPGFVLDLHNTRQAELQLDNLSQAASKKRTRAEAEEELAVAEIDAKRDEINAKRERLAVETEIYRERERMLIRMASEGNPDAIRALVSSRT
jgi:hypothetical protein